MKAKLRIYITDEQFQEYLDRPQVKDAYFDESKLANHQLWCHVCGEFSDYADNYMVWYKWPKGDRERPVNVCPHCGGWDTTQDVGA